MKIEMMAIDKVIPYARNPRRNESGVDKVSASLKEFGWRQPIVCDKEMVVIVGHTRLLAAKKLQMTEVPVHVADMTPAQAKAYRIADNRTSEFAEWDNDLLKLELADLGDMDFNIDLTGFSIDDIAGIGGEVEHGTQDAEPQVDKAADLAEKWGVESGQLWQLGDHRLLCGDSTNKEDYKKVTKGDKIDLVVTDPPYNCADKMDKEFYKNCNSKAMKELSDTQWDKGFIVEDFLNCLSDFKPENGSVYICTSHMLAPAIWKWMENQKASHYGYVCWCKPNPMPSLSKRHFTWATELICYATFGKHVFNFPENGHALNWWNINKIQKAGEHPTQKPVEVIKTAIQYSSNPNAIVLDTFGGSGTTIIACEQLGRKCRAIEINPGYVAVAIQRWADATGKEPKLVS